MSQIGKLIDVVHVALDEAGRAEFVRADAVRRNPPPGERTLKACESMSGEERNVILTAERA